MSQQRNTIRVSGSPWDCGFSAGQQLGDGLQQNITRYIAARPGDSGALDADALPTGAIPWVRGLPTRFQAVIDGLAEGAGIEFQTVAEWLYVEMCVQHACSSFVYEHDGDLWVGRNNDSYVPDMWGYVTIREVDGRIPTMGFSLEGSPTMPTGIIRENLWLHVNALSAGDLLTGRKPHAPSWMLLVEMLEVCSTISDVEAYLRSVERDDGSLLFAVDGKTNEAVLFECGHSTHHKRELAGRWIVGTNHRCATPEPSPESQEGHLPTSEDRLPTGSTISSAL